MFIMRQMGFCYVVLLCIENWRETIKGGVLSPILFSVFIDDLVKLVNKANIGCIIEASKLCCYYSCTLMTLFC